MEGEAREKKAKKEEKERKGGIKEPMVKGSKRDTVHRFFDGTVGSDGEKPVLASIEKIASECREAGASSWDVVKVIKELAGKNIDSEDLLRKEALALLQGINPKAADVYASFNKMHVHTSKQTLESFDRGNIIKSLLKETEITRSIAEKIGFEVENQIKDLKIAYIDTALIRALVNAKLLEYGYENVYKQYVRLGMPVFDVSRKIGKKCFSNREILTEYNLLEVVPEKAREMHFNSDIHISAVEDFSTKPYAVSLGLGEEKDEAKEILFDIFRRANIMKDFFSLPPAIDSLNLQLGFGMKNAKPKEIREIAKMFFNWMDAVFYYPQGKAVSVGLSLFVQDEYDSLKEKDSAIGFADLLLQSYLLKPGNFRVKVAVDNKYRLKLLRKQSIGKGIEFLNCKNHNLKPLASVHYAKFGKGISFHASLNLTKIAIENRGEEKKFFERLEQCVSAIKEAAELKHRIMAEREYLKKAGIALSQLHPALSIDSLFNSVGEFLGNSEERGVMDFSEKVVEAAKNVLGAEWLFTPAANRTAIERFGRENERRFACKPKAESEKDFINSGFLVRKYYSMPCSAKEAGELEELINNGIENVVVV